MELTGVPEKDTEVYSPETGCRGGRCALEIRNLSDTTLRKPAQTTDVFTSIKDVETVLLEKQWQVRQPVSTGNRECDNLINLLSLRSIRLVCRAWTGTDTAFV
ncbi:hypothetical protein RvY_00820 [Ramazzottius varieornatus]|uniref:Uncharacterized protein n=1 Tax=Ramazzottius varieornatus TaxID=947166 RepID=A0A1D1UK88_RAMVA|nr:hypothetical protein RvY_00820 [Ramazzottius varieornatus]